MREPALTSRLSPWRQVAICLAVLMVAWATSSVAATKPTREEIIAHANDCVASDVGMNLIAKFGTDYTGLDLSGIDFRGVHAVGKETNLRGADLTGANLQGAQFGAANLDGAIFRDANLNNVSFVTASVRRADFAGATMQGAELYQSDFSAANMPEIDLSTGSITGSDFAGANLSKAVLSGGVSEYWGVILAGADLTDADLSGLRLAAADFKNATLRGANLNKANLEEADFTGADLTGATFDGANVKAADFRAATGLTAEQSQQLLKAAKRQQFELRVGTKAFLDSPAFAIVPLLLIPALTFGYCLIRPRRSSELNERPPGLQFSLANVFILTLIVGLFIGVGVQSSTGVFTLTMVFAFYLMVGEIVFGRWPSGLTVLATAALLSLINAGLVYLCTVLESFAILAVLPICALVALVVSVLGAVAFFVLGITSRVTTTGPVWFGSAGLTIWFAGVAFANMWIWVEIIASV